MNILFITDTEISPTRGGVDRVNYTLAQALRAIQGTNCHLAYFYSEHTASTGIFKSTLKISPAHYEAQLSSYLAENGVDRIIISLVVKQNVQLLLSKIKTIAGTFNIPVIFWYHNMPGHELVNTSKSVLRYRIRHQKGKLSNIRKLLFSLVNTPGLHKFWASLFLRKKYAYIAGHVDKVVVLSRHNIDAFVRLAGTEYRDKIIAIPNSLSFDTFADNALITEKQKTVLIVARVDEDSKRIGAALKIWDIIEHKQKINDWGLIIVGTGKDENYCKQLARKLHLKHVLFEGRQDSLPYYEKASIFMMTSSNEGFAMTLTEAQQMGTVPVAFDSFGAVHDIITDRYSGLIIPDNDLERYAAQLSWLMQHDEERHAMAKNAVESSKKFEKKEIVQQWMAVLE